MSFQNEQTGWKLKISTIYHRFNGRLRENLEQLIIIKILRFLALIKVSPFLYSLYFLLCLSMSTVILGHLHVRPLNTPSR